MMTTLAAQGFSPTDEQRRALDDATAALVSRGYFSRYPESPSPKVYGQDAATQGHERFEALLGTDFPGLSGQPDDGTTVGGERSPYGPELGVRYPHLDLDAALSAAAAALPAWRDAGPLARAAVCLEIVDAVHDRSFEIAHAVMHTSGQPFVMAFQAGGPHAQDRALEAVAAALAEQQRVPPSVVWEKPSAGASRGDPVRMRKDYRLVPRGVAVVIGCNTFPTWNAYPGLFASLATGNPVVVKPHPHAVLPLAITVACAREVLDRAGFDPALVQLAAEADGEGLAKTLAERPEVAIIDYTGGSSFGTWLERTGAARGALVYTEKAGVNTVVVDSTDDLVGLLRNLAFSFTLYSGQMCTAPQNVYVPRDGVATDEGRLSPADFGARLAEAITTLTADDARAVEFLGATVNDEVRLRASRLADLATEGNGTVLLDSRQVRHPAYPDAVVRTPGLVSVDATSSVYERECFGPVAFLIATASTQASLRRMRETIGAHGAMTASVYSTDEAILDAAREAAADAGVSLSENLTRGVYVNQTTAFSDYHGTGANPAANASYVDAAFVAGRFRVVTSRRHI